MLVGLWALIAPEAARAHGGNPALALVISPPIEGAKTSTSYPIKWVDSNVVIPTGTATVDLFFTSRMPPTFSPGTIPTIEEMPIIQNIPEADITDQYDWDTTSVPAGNYFVWSAVNEPAVEMSVRIISFSPGVLEVLKPNVPRTPWVVISKPDSPFRYADQEYTIEFRSSDPSGTARVRLEVTQRSDGEGLTTIAEDLPAVTLGQFTWNTRDVAQGDWLLKATITDDTGATFSAWGRYFLFVNHLDRSLGDGGLNVGPDSGVPPKREKAPKADDGCRCLASGDDEPSAGLPVVAVLLALAVTSRAPRVRRRAP